MISLENAVRIDSTHTEALYALGQIYTKLDLNDIQMKKGYKGWTAYCNSKLMNVLFTYEIHKRYNNTGVTFNSLHPGFVNTSFGDNNTGLGKNILSIGKKIIAINVIKGASTNVYLASSDEVKNISGKYFDKSKY